MVTQKKNLKGLTQEIGEGRVNHGGDGLCTDD